MKKEDMINKILTTENELWNEFNFWKDVAEMNGEPSSDVIKLARSKWASVNDLVYKLGLRPIRN